MLPIHPKFRSENPNDKSTLPLDTAKIRLIEETTALTISEKINILALFLGYKWVTEVAIDQPAKEASGAVLQQLSLPYKENYYKHSGEHHTWLQVATNKAILHYILENRESLSIIEAGVLYGYPVSHSLGYAGMLEKRMKGKNKTIAEFYLSGVFSQDYNARETEHFETVWNDIIKQSPVIACKAKEHYDDSEHAFNAQNS